MPVGSDSAEATAVIDVDGLDRLLAELARRGHRVVGPTVRDAAIVYDEITSVADLPRGWTEVQDGGSYRMVARDDDALFGYAVGPHSWKRFLFPPRSRLWGATRTPEGFELDEGPTDVGGPYAFIAVRPCDLHAIAIQDRVFLGGDAADPIYRANRHAAFVMALNCSDPSGTCFCTSMGTGPRADTGFDLALTELLGDDHRFLVEVASTAGADVLDAVTSTPATADDRHHAQRVTDGAVARMGRSLETDGLRQLLADNLEHPRWDDVASRCLGCANCTMVCPTCFCSTVEDVTDLSGDHAERWRRWDSCFTLDFSHLHGGAVRSSTRSRYRQWLTHKLGTWWDQFDSSGCVGCGRCITWCPVGIDLTAEIAAIRSSPADPTDRAEPADRTDAVDAGDVADEPEGGR